MKSPLKINFLQPDAGVLEITNKYPSDFNYALNFAEVLYTSCDLGEFVVQSVKGKDYWLEVWWFAVNKNGSLEIFVAEAQVIVAVFLKGNLEGNLTGHGKVYTDSKTINVFYVPAGIHQIQLKKEEYFLLYFIPPPNSFHGMTIEHAGIEELIERQLQQNRNGTLLRGFSFPKDAWMKLKRMETISQKAFALDLPLRQFMIELLNYYSEGLRKHEYSLPINSSSKEKAIALREYIFANLDDAELESVNEMAKRFYISSKTLTKEFKLLTGMTIHQYIVDQRLDLAKKLLHETKQPLVDIVTQAGFKDSSHFIKKFKKKFGYTPRKKKGDV